MDMTSITDLNMNIMKEMDRFVHLCSIADLNFIEVRNFETKIVINYTVKDPDLKNVYRFEIENTLVAKMDWIGLQIPYLTLLSPQIKPNLDIHLLSNSNVCYTFPGDIRYNKGLTCGYTIEQSFKWVFGYEFYLKEHYWPFAEMPHGIYPNQWGFYRPAMVA
jgi:hypothetical protein